MESLTSSGVYDIQAGNRDPKATPRSWRLSMLLVILAGVLPALAQQPANLENGFKHWGSYEGGSLDTVNNLNGNQMLHAPLLPNYPQRGGKLAMQISLYQTSKSWQVGCSVQLNNQVTCQWALGRAGVSVREADGVGIQRTMHQDSSGTGQTTYRALGYSLIDAADATHQLTGSGPVDTTGESTEFDSIDTSGYHVVMSNPDGYGVMQTATVTDRHGNQYIANSWTGGSQSGTTAVCSWLPGNHLAPAPDGGLGNLIQPIIDDAPLGQQDCPQYSYAGQVTDSNGNFIGNPELGGTDTLGRAFSFFTGSATTTDYSGCVSSHTISAALVESYTAPDGSSRQIKLCYGNIPISSAFNVSAAIDSTGYSVQQLVTVILADSTKWTFDYDNYGEATFIGLPMGGSISYTWTTIAFPSCAIYDGGVSRAVASRTVNDNNGHTTTWFYSWGTVVNGAISNTVKDPLGNDTVHTFTAFDGVGVGACGFYETRTQSYQGTGGSRQLLKQVDTTYSPAFYNIETPYASGLGSVVPTNIQTTVYPSGKVSLVTKQYDSGPGAGLPIFGNVTVEKDYDWSQGTQVLLRETDTSYEGQVNSAYAHLADLPATVIVKDGSGCALAETDYTYDEPGYLTAANIGTQHAAPPGPVRGNLSTATKWLAPASTCNPKGGTAIVSHTNWYDTGEVYQQIDPLGHITTHSYDSAYVGAYSTQTCSPATNGGAVTHCVSGTYDFNTGVLTSLTNENATTQASGNTPGDSAHTSNYSYDYMWRITSAQAPPDPTNGGARAQTTLTYSAPGTFPLNIQQQKSVTNALTDSATAFFDGLARSYQGQHVTPGGTVTVNTTFDGLGHAASVTNPFYSTSDSTYGVSSSQYDALGRVTQVTKQDGSVSTVSYTDNCTTTVDEAGKQRKSCSDALGRLIEVDEPNPGAVAATATGWVSLSGTEQAANSQPASSASVTVTIDGTDTMNTTVVCNPLTGANCHTFTAKDTGTMHFTVTVGGVTVGPVSVAGGYTGSSTPVTLAAALYTAFTTNFSTNSVVSMSNPNGTAAFTLTTVATGSSMNSATITTSMATSCTDSDNTACGGVGWTMTLYGPNLAQTTATSANFTGGVNASSFPDTGTVTATINGTAYAVGYGAGDTTASVAGRLAASISAGTWVNASSSGSTINLTSKSAGWADNYSLAGSYTWNTGQFTNPSFTTSISGGNLGGGLDAAGLNNHPFVTLYSYDGLGNLLTVTQKGDPTVTTSSQWRVRNFTYDTLGRLLTAQNPESGTISYSYDADGNLLHKTSPAPNQTGTATQTISYCYDEMNRITGRAYSAQSCPLSSPPVSYAYDSGANAKGKLTSFTDQAGSGSYTYDVLGRMSSETRVIAGISKSMSYAYNLDGSLKTLTYPSGASVTYTPDSAGRMLSAVDSGNGINYVTGATYGPDSGLTGFVSGNTGGFAGITNAFSYNKRLQPINMSATAPGQTVFSIGYDFHVGNGTTGSDNGNVWAITNYKDNSRNQSFTYDPLNRLTSAQNAGTDCSATTVNGKTEYWGNSYGYDAWGNLLQKTMTKCGAENLSVAALANNQLTGYGYDAPGNMTWDPTDSVTPTYDPENRIATATKNGVTTTYTYDDDGNRVEKTSGSTGTLYWYMSPGIVAESDLAGNLQSEYVFFDGERVARKDFPGLAVSYYFSDHLKTASVITDAAGNIKSESDYYPWGGELQFTNNDSNHYKFTGKERDAETGLDYFGARYYSNGLGRFITPDWAAKATAVPYANFGDPQTLNLYSYVRNIPTTRFDPDGHDATVDDPNKRPQAQKDLNKLAPGSRVDSNGHVHKPGFFHRVANHLTGHGAGTSLVSQLVDDHQHNTHINPIPGSGDASTRWNGGRDIWVEYDSDGLTAQTRLDGTANGPIGEAPAAGQVVLGHELVHALHDQDGTNAGRAMGDHQFVENGIAYSEHWRTEEFRTTGFAPFARPGDITENQLRKEQGAPARATYTDRDNWDPIP